MKLKIKQNKIDRNLQLNKVIDRQIKSYIKNPKGSIDLYDLPITRIPKNLKVVNGNLDISWTDISELPKGLVVNGYLDIEGTKIADLPNDIIIKGNLYYHSTPLRDKYPRKVIKHFFTILEKKTDEIKY